ncbi:MAG: hypothetical protein R6X02_00560 [Enhygromyxa sp.]
MAKLGKPHQITREDFHNNREKVFELASSGRQVVIVDDEQRPTTIIVTPRDKQPMRFD